MLSFKNSLIYLKRYFYLFLLITIVACSESGDDSPDNTGSNSVNTEIENKEDDTTIQITAKDYQSISIQWDFNSEYPLSKLSFTTPISTAEKYFGLGNTYTVTNLEPDTRYFFKVYYCKSYEECYEKAEFITTKTDSFTAPKNFTVQAIQYNTIKLNWDLYEYADYYVLYQIEADADEVEIYSGTEITHSLTNLNQNTLYTFAIKSCIQLDTLCSITDTKIAKTPYISNDNKLSGRMLGISKIDLYFDSPSDNLMHKLYYGLSKDDNKKLLHTSDSTTYRIQGLTPNTQYTFWSQTCLLDDRECSLFTDPIHIKTDQIFPPDKINSSIKPLNKIALKWTKVSNAHYYKIYQSKDNGLNKEYLLETKEGSIIVNNLDLNTNYYYWITSCTDQDECSSFSNQQFQRTQEYDAPSEFHITLNATRTIEFSWSKSLIDYNQTHYIYYSQIDDFDQAELLTKTNQQSYSKYGFNLNETYYFWIRSCLEEIVNNCSHLSQILEGSTINIQPPKDIFGQVINSNVIQLFWSSKSYIQEHVIEYYLNTKQDIMGTITSSNENAIFNNLNNQSIYYFKLKSCIPTENVCSDYSDFIRLKTQNISEPYELVTKAIDSQKVEVSWNYHTNDELVDEFRVFAISHRGTNLVYQGSNTFVLLEGLYADTNYNFAVRACSYSNLCSKLSHPSTIQTPPIPSPKNLQAELTSSISLLLNWEGNSQSIFYKIYKTLSSTIENKILIFNNIFDNYFVKDLEMDTIYKFTVHSCNVLNQCSQGVVVEITTPDKPLPVTGINYTHNKNNNEYILNWEARFDGAYYKITHYSEFENRYYDLGTITGTELKVTNLLPNSNHLIYISTCNEEDLCSDPYEFNLITEAVNLFKINQDLYMIDLHMDTIFSENEFIKIYMQGTKPSKQSYTLPMTISGSHIQVTQLEYSQDYNFVLSVCDLTSIDCANKKAISNSASVQTNLRTESFILWLGSNNSILEYYVNKDAEFISTIDSNCNTVNYSTCNYVSQANLLKTPQNFGDRYKKDGLRKTSTVELSSINRSKVMDNNIDFYGFLKNSYLDEFNQTQYYHTKFMITKQKRDNPQISRGNNSAIFRNSIYIIGGSNNNIDAGIWKTADGIYWESTIDSPADKLYGNSTIVFKNHMYIIGGEFGNSSTQVWRSKDGVNWEDMQKAPWNIGLFALSFVFKDILYHIPSQDTQIWQTTDGANWSEVIQENSIPSRSGASYVELNGYVYIIGGFYWLNNVQYPRNDIWRSNDMKNWEKVTDNMPMKNIIFSKVLVYNEVIYFIGGFHSTNEDYLNAVWKSTDAKNWSLVTNNANFEARAFHSAEVFNNKMYIMGGIQHSNIYNDTWYSVDGENWQKSKIEDRYLPLNSMISNSDKTDKMIKFREYVYFFNTYSGKVFNSEDGVNFQMMGELPFSHRSNSSIAIFKNRIYLFGGIDYSNYSKYYDAYWSEDGTTWNNLDINYGQIYKNTFFEHKEKLYMLGGVDSNNENSSEIWVSQTGESNSWEKLDSNFEFGINPVVQTHSGTIYVFTHGVDNVYVYKSIDDGMNWSQIATQSDLGDINRQDASFFIFDDRLFITSGLDNGTQYNKDIYVSDNLGGSWYKLTDGLWSARNRMKSVIFEDHIYLYGGVNTEEGLLLDIYRSSNGVDWYQSYLLR